MFDDRQTAGSKEPVDGPRLVRDDFSVNRVEQRDADISPWTYSPDIFPSRTISPPFYIVQDIAPSTTSS